MRKAVSTIIPIFIVLIWLMPVSNTFNTLNDSMMRNCYLASLAMLVLVWFYECKFYAIQIGISAILMFLLIASTFVNMNINAGISKVSHGYLMNYLPFCILLNIKCTKLSRSKIIDKLFIMVCIVLIVVGILTIISNPTIENILKTYYTIHYPHLYNVMWASHKTVTFFGTHSIAAYIYFILWWLVDYRRQVKPGMLNYVLMLGILMDIAMCLSVSAVLCLGIIFSYYFVGWLKSASKSAIIRSFILLIVFMVGVILNIETIITILSSSQNGLLGRFGSTGNLNSTLSFAIKNVFPIGICDIEGLWLTDGGYFINFIRGGVIFVVLFYVGLYRFINKNIQVKSRAVLLFFALILFEVGYQFTTCMRFFMTMLFAIIYFSYLFEQSQRNVCIQQN